MQPVAMLAKTSGMLMPRSICRVSLATQTHTSMDTLPGCVGFAQVLAVVGENRFPDESGASTLAFPEGRTPRRD